MTEAVTPTAYIPEAPESEAAAPNPPSVAQTPVRHGDLTQGPILKTLLVFSIPTLIGNVLQTLNGSINAMWVGRLIGESALAATANANVIMFLMFAGVFGFGMATTVKVGQHFGAKSLHAARRTFGSGVGFCILMSLIVGVAGRLFTHRLLQAMATPPASMAEAEAYLGVVFITMPFGTASMMLQMGMRGAGDSKSPLYAMILTVVLDILLNPLLIRGAGPLPALGTAGSAISTGLANLAGTGLLLWRLYGKDLPLRLRGSELRYLIPLRSEVGYIVTKGLPMGAQMLLASGAQITILGLVNREGLETSAAYSATLQLWNYLQMPAFAIGSAVSAMVAQNIGAGQHDRVGQVTRVGVFTAVAFTAVVGAFIILASGPLLAIFLSGDGTAIGIGQHILWLATWSFMLSGVMMTLTSTMRAYGAVVVPLIVLAITFYPLRLGFYFAAHAELGADALWWAFPFSSVISVLMTWWVYTRGGWRKKRAAAYSAPSSA